MDRLKHIVSRLKSYEVELIKSTYGAKGRAVSKKLKLLNLVLDKNNYDDQSTSLLIYGHPPDSKFSQLKKRLKEDVLNTISMQSSWSGNFDPIEADIQARKLLLQGKILMQRSIVDEARELFLKALQIADKYEIVDVKLTTYDLLRTLAFDQNEEDEVKNFSTTIGHCLITQKDLFTAKSIHYDVVYNDGEDDQIEDKASVLKNLRSTLEQVPIVSTEFWCHMAELRFFKDMRAYKKAYVAGRELLHLIDNNPQIASIYHIRLVKLEIANMLIHLGRNKKAILYAREALACKIQGRAYLVPLEILYFGHFRRMELDEASGIVKKANRQTNRNQDIDCNVKWTLYEAYIAFAKGHYAESLSLLNTNYVISRGQTELALAVRTLELMNMIEINDSDWLEFKIENYRKILQRNKLGNLTRYAIIYKIFNTLVKSNCDFVITKTKELQALKKLEAIEGTYQWDAMGYEVINFEHWFTKHVNAQVEMKDVKKDNFYHP